MQYGKVTITIIDPNNNNEIAYSKTFEKSKEPVVESFNLTRPSLSAKSNYSYFVTKVEAIEEAYFSYMVASTQGDDK